MASEVTAPDGSTWHVRRRLAPRLGNESLWGRFHRRYRKTVERTGDAADLDPGCLDAIGEGFVAFIAIVIAAVVLIFVLIPLLVAIVDVLIVLLLGVLGIGARIVLRRPWTVEATSSTGEVLRWRVVGWRASGEHVAAIANELQAGIRRAPDTSSRIAPPDVPPAPAPRPPKGDRPPANKPSRAVVIAWIVIGLAGVALMITMYTVVRDAEPSYRPPGCDRTQTRC